MITGCNKHNHEVSYVHDYTWDGECPLCVAQAKIEQFEDINSDLLEACKAMERLSSIWLPMTTDAEHLGEAQALHDARQKILDAIAKAEGAA